MNLKKFSIVLTAIATMCGTGAFAQGLGVGVNTPLGGVGVGAGAGGIGIGANALGIGANVGVGTGLGLNGYGINGAPLYVAPGYATSNINSFPAVIDNGGIVNPVQTYPRTWFDASFFGRGLHFFGRRGLRGVQTINSMPMVIPQSCGSCQQQTVEQPAVVQPEPQTQMLHDTITTTTTTRLITRHFAARVMARKHAHKCLRVKKACQDYGS